MSVGSLHGPINFHSRPVYLDASTFSFFLVGFVALGIMHKHNSSLED